MNGLTGTRRLCRLALRRDRAVLSSWILGLTSFMAAITAMSVDGLATREDLVQETQLMARNPAMRMLGLASGPSIGGYTLIRGYVTIAILAALMSTMAVVRHTRQNEELGRAEMLGATVVGRYASLAAAVLVAAASNIVLALLLGLAMVVNGQPVAGSLAAGASIGGVGLVFVGVAATSSQLASTSRGAIGLASSALGPAFVLCGVGNVLGTVDTRALHVSSAWPVWLSPIGWGQQMRPFGGDHWWPLVLFSGLFVCLVATAGALASRRDVGRGVWPERRGRATGTAALLSMTGLVWRLQRGATAGWAVGLLGFGIVFGTLSQQIQDVSGSALEWYTRMGGTHQILDAYRASIIEMAGMTVAIYAVQMLLRIRTDEADGTLEATLATGVSRLRWILAHVVNAFACAVVLILVFAVSMSVAGGHILGDTANQFRELTTAGLVQLPGIIVIGSVVIAAVGMLPRWAVPLSWAALLAALLLGPMFGATLGLPEWMQDLSPFSHIPKAPAAAVDAAPLVALVGLAVVVAAVGLLAIRRRDLVLPA
jgi:ABC-2 type transport system permease protein